MCSSLDVDVEELTDDVLSTAGPSRAAYEDSKTTRHCATILKNEENHLVRERLK